MENWNFDQGLENDHFAPGLFLDSEFCGGFLDILIWIIADKISPLKMTLLPLALLDKIDFWSLDQGHFCHLLGWLTLGTHKPTLFDP